MSKQLVDTKKHLITSFNKVNETNINLQGLTEINDKEKWLIWSFKCTIEPKSDYVNEIKLQRLLSLDTFLNKETTVHKIAYQNSEDFPEFLSNLENDVRNILDTNRFFHGIYDDEAHFTEDFQNELKTLPNEFYIKLTLSKKVNGKKIYTYNPHDLIKDALETWQAIKPFIDVINVGKQVNRENGSPITVGIEKGIRIYDLTPEEFIALACAMFKNNK